MEPIIKIPMFLLVIAVLLIVALFGVWLYSYQRNHNLEQIRERVYKLFVVAENKFYGSEQGKQKMKWVVSQARMLLPSWLRNLLTDEALERIIQAWFDCVKDLLDDGKANGTGKAKK